MPGMSRIQEVVGIVGLGYVGLPLAVALSSTCLEVIGFDISDRRIRELAAGFDVTQEIRQAGLSGSKVRFTGDPHELKACSAVIVCVPTPVDEFCNPDLEPLLSATRLVGAHLRAGAVVIFESTFYPGLTEETLRPLLGATSGLTPGTGFTVAYSPERMNPGDTEHTLQRIVKVVSGEDAPTLERVAAIYGSVVEAGIHRAPSIKVAEAAKVIENTQRDLNIALMNELALIFDRLDIRTSDVLEAACTKWNFLPFRPGLVGGHCIGVDPYYLTTKAKAVGYHPQVILAGRKINDEMGEMIGRKTVKLLAQAGKLLKGARVGILGLTFKENVSDIRNSKVPDIVRELEGYGIDCLIHDPKVPCETAAKEYGITLVEEAELGKLDAIVMAVRHQQYLDWGPRRLESMLVTPGVFVDVKSAYRPSDFCAAVRYWSL